MAWDRTHGKARGGYLRAGGSELYVRQVLGADGLPSGTWRLYVNGQLEGQANGEATARAAAELAIRCVLEAEAADQATAA